MIRSIPNVLTLCNLFAGACAVAALFSGNPEATLILAASCLVLDFLDGLLARRMNASSALGVQLDSLADLVSFGVLPAGILFTLMTVHASSAALSILPYTAFIIAAATAVRLARFNLDTRERKVFYGLPTPSAATLVFGLLWMQTSSHPWWPIFGQIYVLYGLVLLLPFLMLSDLRLWSAKGIRHAHGKWILGILIISLVLLLITTGPAGIPLMVVLYVFLGVVNLYLKVY